MTPTPLLRDAVTKRLRYLWTWELADSFILPAMVIGTAHYIQRPLGACSYYACAVVALLLWQGSAYWWLKLRALQRGIPLGTKQLRYYAVFRVANWILLLVPPVALAFLPGAYFASSWDAFAAIMLYVLAWLEQINYYYYQLMYDCPADVAYLRSHRKLKRSSLSQDLARMASAEYP